MNDYKRIQLFYTFFNTKPHYQVYSIYIAILDTELYRKSYGILYDNNNLLLLKTKE